MAYTQDQQAAYAREHYQRNKALYKQRAVESKKRFLDWMKNLKIGRSCERCGESHPATLDFHHRDATQKTFTISSGGRYRGSRKQVLAEIEKCIILCSNCHRKLHWDEERNPTFDGRDNPSEGL